MRFQVLTAASMKMIAFWGTAPCSLVAVDRRLALMMEAVHTSETSDYYEAKRCNILEGYHFQG
jgi:hypothetical protein